MSNGVCIIKALLLFDPLTVTSLIINALRTKVFDQEDIQSNQKSTFIQYSAILRKIDNITQDQLFISFFTFFPVIAYYKINGSDGKVSDCSVGDPGSIPGSGRSPGEEYGNPLQYCCLEKLNGQRSLVGCRTWGCKELDTAERLHFHFFIRY